jgi:hypothetical protein
VTDSAAVAIGLGRLSGEGIGDAVNTPHPSNTFWSAARAELGLLPLTSSALRRRGGSSRTLRVVGSLAVIGAVALSGGLGYHKGWEAGIALKIRLDGREPGSGAIGSASVAGAAR